MLLQCMEKKVATRALTAATAGTFLDFALADSRRQGVAPSPLEGGCVLYMLYIEDSALISHMPLN